VRRLGVLGQVGVCESSPRQCASVPDHPDGRTERIHIRSGEFVGEIGRGEPFWRSCTTTKEKSVRARKVSDMR
jgi:anti-sigma factor ChrR (cupin superfamily)